MAILDERTLDFTSSSAAQTERLGLRLGELLRPGDVIALSGELGAGKTMLARGIGRGWGTAVRVTSPTYIIVNEYPRLRDGAMLYHIDGYRLEREVDVVSAGLEDIFERGGAIIVEWPERIESLLPADCLTVQLMFDTPTRRRMRFNAGGDRSTALLEDFKMSAFGV
jgi:tRNA threonylcarbamoyladenosine biosynthesis protein TsaE